MKKPKISMKFQTINAFAFANGYDVRTVARRLQNANVKAVKRVGRWRHFRVADMASVMAGYVPKSSRDSDAPNLTEERAKKARIDRIRAEREYNDFVRNLVPTELVFSVLKALIGEVRKRFRRIPERVHERIAAMTDCLAIKELLVHETDTELRDLLTVDVKELVQKIIAKSGEQENR